jgi:hypothetical protein
MPTIRKDVTLAEVMEERAKAEAKIMEAIRSLQWLGVEVRGVSLTHHQTIAGPNDVAAVSLTVEAPTRPVPFRA